MGKGGGMGVPLDQVDGIWGELDVVWEKEVLLPVDDLSVGAVGALGGKGRPADEALVAVVQLALQSDLVLP